jgi:hypothetical protein
MWTSTRGGTVAERLSQRLSGAQGFDVLLPVEDDADGPRTFARRLYMRNQDTRLVNDIKAAR